MLGICLGSQLIADVLGGKVTKNKYQEIGWFNVNMIEDADKYGIMSGVSGSFEAFHWHGDTYALPAGAICLASSEACAQQAFSWGDRVLGLQFHLEVTLANAREWLRVDPPLPDRYVQSPEQILADGARFTENNRWMCRVLKNMESI